MAAGTAPAGKASKSADSPRQLLLEFSSMAAIICAIVAGLGTFAQWRNEETLRSGVETTAEIVRVVRRPTQSIQGSSSRDAYFIDFNWQSGSERRGLQDRQVSDSYARKLELAAWSRGNGTVVRIHYRPADVNAPPIMLDDRGFYRRLRSELLAGLTIGLAASGGMGLVLLRRLRRREAETSHVTAI